MKCLKGVLLSAVLLIVLMTTSVGTGTAEAFVHCAYKDWKLISGPTPSGAQGTALNQVAVISENDIWTVGDFYRGSISKTLIEHWDGGKWSIVPSPNIGSDSNYLTGVAAISTNNVWTVGTYMGSKKTLIEHWDGGKWSIVPSPNIGSDANYLASIAAVSTNNIWAVGLHENIDDSDQTLIEHWDGSKWSIIPSPNHGSDFNYLTGIAAVSTNNIWAVGGYASAPRTGQTLIEHWDGSKWSIVPSPTIGDSTAYSNLAEVAAVSTNNIWAVGLHSNTGGADRTLIEHWDGSKWSIVPSPNTELHDNDLTGIVAISTGDIWTVGVRYNDNSAKNVRYTLIEHWNGRAWSIVPSLSPGSAVNYLTGVAADSVGRIWTVGYYGNNGSATRPLTEVHSCDQEGTTNNVSRALPRGGIGLIQR